MLERLFAMLYIVGFLLVAGFLATGLQIAYERLTKKEKR